LTLRPSFPRGGALLHDNIKVTMTANQLNGSQRVLLDGVISEDECRELHSLSNVSDGQDRACRGVALLSP